MPFSPVPPLRPNDKVAVIAPAGPFDRESFDAGLEVLATRYQPEFSEGLFSAHRYLAGDDARRFSELHRALSSRAIFCARGGYGVMRLLGRLNPADVRPAPLVGFSDITALHAAWARAGLRSLHGPVLTQLGNQPPDVVERLFHLLESTTPPSPLPAAGAWGTGSVEGPLLGGNLSVLTRLLGTGWMPPLDGAVLLVEDVGERPYRLDRMWTHLQLAGVLDRIAGIALGDLTGCDEKDGSVTGLEVLSELIRATGKPALHGLPIGHGKVNQPVVLGARVRLDTAAARLEFLEPLVTA